MALLRLQGEDERQTGVYYEYDNESSPLGEGAMGRVFRGCRVIEATGESMPVAIKCIYDDIPERVIERAKREASVKIDHKNLLRMYAFIEVYSSSVIDGMTVNRKSYFIVMELLDGVTLSDFLNGRLIGPMGNTWPALTGLRERMEKDKALVVADIMTGILDGLQALHNAGFLHRDLDPSNIMVTADGGVKIIDFGICKPKNALNTQDKGLTVTGVFMGKPDYASPELATGDVIHQNQTTDIYAVGVILFLLCTGHVPFTGASNDILAAHMRCQLPVKEIKITPYRKIVAKATEKIQSKRYQSALAFKVDIEKAKTTSMASSDARWLHFRIIAFLSGIGVAFFVCLLIGALVVIPKNAGKRFDTITATASTDDSAANKNTLEEHLKMLDSTTLTSLQIKEIEKAVKSSQWSDTTTMLMVKSHIQAIKHIQLRCVQSADHSISDLKELFSLYSDDLSVEQQDIIRWLLLQEPEVQEQWENEKIGFTNLQSVKDFFVSHQQIDNNQE